MFKRFDTNKDGFFNEVEFSCAFTVLKVDFKREDLHKLIRLTDTDNDGRISYTELEAMLNQDDEVLKPKDGVIDEVMESSDSEGEVKSEAQKSQKSQKSPKANSDIASVQQQ